MDVKKEGEEKSIQDKERDKRLKRNCTCVIILIVLLFSFGLFLFFRFNGDLLSTKQANDTKETTTKPVPPKPANSDNEDQSLPKTANCEQVNITNAEPLNISINKPGLSQDVNTFYYDVYGSVASVIREQMNECGPKEEGESFDGYTSYYVNWVFDIENTGSLCRLSDVAVGANVKIYLPRWDDKSGANVNTKEKWDNYISLLSIHENGHRDSGINAAKKILETLSSFEGDCRSISADANKTADEIMVDYNAKDDAYDVETDHGRNQGVSFP